MLENSVSIDRPVDKIANSPIADASEARAVEMP